MSKKSEEAALKAYPVKMTPLVYQDLIDQFGGKTEIEVNTYPRCLFQEGYEQAEKDLALTWEDIRLICEIDEDMRCHSDWPLRGEEVYYEEVLRRFHEMKNK